MDTTKDKFEEQIDGSVNLTAKFKEDILKHYEEIKGIDVNSGKFGTPITLHNSISSLIYFLDNNTESVGGKFLHHKEHQIDTLKAVRDDKHQTLYDTKNRIISLLGEYCKILEKGDAITSKSV